jgi:circadian clock protein KaiC
MTFGRIPSGHDRLDDLLGGGLLQYGINLIMGLPGSGKTILAQQYLFRNSTPEHPGIYLSTVSEPLDKILRYGQSLAFFDGAAVGSSVFYEDLGETLNSDGLAGVLEAVDGLLKGRRPGLLAIDSFKALVPYAADRGDFRRFLHELAGKLSASPVTTFWVGEYSSEEIAEAPEFAVADAILSMTSERAAHRELRVLQVVKLRGSGFITGRHAYRLSNRGIDVFPRLADPADPRDYALSESRTSSGVRLLDEMIGDGYWKGSSTMVVGPSGSGKTLLGLHFIFGGIDKGERGLIATFQENPIQLERICNGYGWSLDNSGIEVMYRSPVDLYVDEWVYELLDRAKRKNASRIMIDSLGDVQSGAGDEVRFREYVYSLLQRTSRSGVGVIMTQEIADLFESTQLSERGVSHLSDNVILLQFLRGDSEIKRAITVIKTRASAHDPRIRQFDITSEGLQLGESFAGDQNLR